MNEHRSTLLKVNISFRFWSDQTQRDGLQERLIGFINSLPQAAGCKIEVFNGSSDNVLPIGRPVTVTIPKGRQITVYERLIGEKEATLNLLEPGNELPTNQPTNGVRQRLHSK